MVRITTDMTTCNEKSPRNIRGLDLFAGMGGSSWGAIAAGVHIVAAIDMWDLAKSTYQDNFPSVRCLSKRVEQVSPKVLQREIGDIQVLIASPECTSHSCARGSLRPSEESQETAFQVNRFARALEPRWIIVENVINMRSWARYNEWLDGLASLGYNLAEVVLDASEFGVPQSRKRLFVLGDSERLPPSTIQARCNRAPTIQPLLDLDGKYGYSALVSDGRSISTLERAKRAIAVVGPSEPFLLVYYGSDGPGGWQSVNRPLRTITTVDRFAIVRPDHTGGHEMRMLQVPELQRAMGFPATFKMRHGSRREKIRLLGNAVCPPVMCAVIKAVVGRDHDPT